MSGGGFGRGEEMIRGVDTLRKRKGGSNSGGDGGDAAGG